MSLKVKQLPPPPDIVEIRLKEYVHRKWKSNLNTLPALKRAVVVFYLRDHCAYTQKQIAELLAISQPTVSRDYQTFGFYLNRSYNYHRELQRLADYILYNAKWVPVV